MDKFKVILSLHTHWGCGQHQMGQIRVDLLQHFPPPSSQRSSFEEGGRFCGLVLGPIGFWSGWEEKPSVVSRWRRLPQYFHHFVWVFYLAWARRDFPLLEMPPLPGLSPVPPSARLLRVCPLVCW